MSAADAALTDEFSNVRELQSDSAESAAEWAQLEADAARRLGERIARCAAE